MGSLIFHWCFCCIKEDSFVFIKTSLACVWFWEYSLPRCFFNVRKHEAVILGLDVFSCYAAALSAKDLLLMNVSEG